MYYFYYLEDGETIGKAYVAEIRILKSIKNDNIV